MKKIVHFILLTFVITAFAHANQPEKSKSNKFRIDELAFLVHPMKPIKQGKVQITDEMRQRIADEVQSNYTVVFHEKLNEAFKLEKKLQRGVTDGKTKEELKELIDEIAKLKREALDARIDALNTVRAILPEETWKKINQEWYK